MAPGTILLVDDDDTIRRVVRAMLELQGYAVVDVGVPAMALALFERNPAAFDLLITDVRMPGMSGPTLADRLAVSRPELPVVFITGSLEATRSAELQRTGHRTLAKPFEAAALLDMTRTLLSARETQAQ